MHRLNATCTVIRNKVITLADMNKPIIDKHTLGRAELISLPEIDVIDIPARIDTGAKTSAIWATDIRETNGELSFYLFDESSAHHRPVRHTVMHYKRIIVTSTIGASEERYKVKLLLKLGGRTIRASFTLANRSRQVYPVLIGRNVLKGKFIVDVDLDRSGIAKDKQEDSEQMIKNLEGDRI